jgi:hypothetical protein
MGALKHEKSEIRPLDPAFTTAYDARTWGV